MRRRQPFQGADDRHPVTLLDLGNPVHCAAEFGGVRGRARVFGERREQDLLNSSGATAHRRQLKCFPIGGSLP